jgi:uncharacterized membrane protein
MKESEMKRPTARKDGSSTNNGEIERTKQTLEMINEKEDHMLAWQSVPGCTVSNAGSVWFEPT